MPKPRFKPTPYTCIRCGYSTNDKSRIRDHFNRKIKCPGTINSIELSEEVIQYILDNRVYIIQKPTPVTQVINNIQTINNFVINMTPIEKLSHVIKYKNNGKITNLEYVVKDRFEDRNNKFDEDDQNRLLSLHKDDIHDVVHRVTRCKRSKEFTDYCIIYTPKLQKLTIKNDSVWTDYLLEQGIKYILNQLKVYHLDNYEQYLIKRIETTKDPLMRQKCDELLVEYYVFLASFEIEPLVSSTFSDHINGVPLETLRDKYMPKYEKAKNKTPVSQQKRYRSLIEDTIKLNCKSNIEDLNKHLMSLIQIDSEFKDRVFGAKAKLV